MADLVFLHGAGDSAAAWERQVKYFGGRHRVLALDLPGHGERRGEAALGDHDQNADEVTRQVRDNGMAEPILIGHSMGGGIALTVALRHPELPRGLVLVASGARLRMHPDFVEAARRRAAEAPDALAEGAIPLEKVVSPGASAETRAWLQARAGRATAAATYADFVATDGFDVMERLAEIGHPVLVLAGEDDQMTPPKYQHFLAERLPNARLVLLPDAGHYPQVEQAEAFNRELERFLAS